MPAADTGGAPRGATLPNPSTRTQASVPTPMERCLDSWHSVLSGDHAALAALVADDAVLHSPIVYTPQRGKDKVLFYLTGALMTFGGADRDDQPTAVRPDRMFTGPDGQQWDGRFRYVRTVVDTHDAILEFETTMKGRYVNGVDMIRCDDEGHIVDFKVMIRPLQAVNTVHALMASALETLKGHS